MASQSQENTQPGPPIHEEIQIENTESDQETEHGQEAHVKVENERNIMKSFEHTMVSPKPNTNNDFSKSFYKPTAPKTKVTEWDTVTHIKLSKDAQLPPLPVQYKENDNLNDFYCFSKPEMERDEILLHMISLYDNWRTHYNDVNGFNKVEVNGDRAGLDNSLSEEVVEENVETLREKTPDITDDNDFPTLGGRTRSLRSASNKPSTSRQLIEVDLADDFEEKEDPDDADFIPVSQTRKKTNKKPVYKKATDNIFDFNESATAWQATAEVPSTTKRVEPKSIIKPEPAVQEETIACPICNKPFPMSQIENHASDCLSFEDTPVQSRKRCKNPPQNSPLLENIEDAILLSDDDRVATDWTSLVPEASTPRINKKRPLTHEETTSPSLSKRPCLKPN